MLCRSIMLAVSLIWLTAATSSSADSQESDALKAATECLHGQFTKEARETAEFGSNIQEALRAARLSSPIRQYVIDPRELIAFRPPRTPESLLHPLQGYTFLVLIGDAPKGSFSVHQKKETGAWSADAINAHPDTGFFGAVEIAEKHGAKSTGLMLIAIPEGPYSVVFVGWMESNELWLISAQPSVDFFKLDMVHPVRAKELFPKLGPEYKPWHPN